MSKSKNETSIYLRGSNQIDKQSTKDNSALDIQSRGNLVESIYHNGKPDKFLHIQKFDLEDLKTLYTEFNAGKKPVTIIAEYGYHPELVEFENQRFLRLYVIDVNALLKHIIAYRDKYSKPKGILSCLLESIIVKAVWKAKISINSHY